MPIARARVLSLWLVGLCAATIYSCGQDESSSPNVHTSDGGSDSETAAGQSNGGSGNAAASGSGGSHVAGTATGGAPLVADGAAATSNDAGAGAGGIINTPQGEQLVLCNRLVNVVPHATDISKAFSKAAYADCRVKWVVPLQQAQLIDYLNRLRAWSLEFWGCQGEPVTDFALAYDQPPLSRGDSSILIQLYLDLVDTEVDLSAPERAVMQAALQRLAAPLLVSDSPEPSRPKCTVDPGVGGAGGADSAGAGGAAGAAGQAGFGGIEP